MNLNKYKSPTHESSCFKGIPIKYRYHPSVNNIMKSRMFSVKYRGSSKLGYKRPQNYTVKDYADTFAIYPYSSYPEYSEMRQALWNGGNCDYDSYWKKLEDTMSEKLNELMGESI